MHFPYRANRQKPQKWVVPATSWAHPQHLTPEQASPAAGEVLPLIWPRLSTAPISFIHRHWRIVLLFDKKPHSHTSNAVARSQGRTQSTIIYFATGLWEPPSPRWQEDPPPPSKLILYEADPDPGG